MTSTTTTTTTTIDIEYVNGLCGAGKTYASARIAKQLVAAGKKVLLVQPTTLLIDQTIVKTFAAVGIDRRHYKTINGNTHGNVITEITNHLKNCEPGGEILVITHAAFFGIKHFRNKQNWIVIIDEIPQVDVSHEMHIPDSHHLLTSHIEVVDTSSTQYHRIAAKIGSTGLADVAKNRNGDIVYNQFSKFADHVLTPSWEVYVDAPSYHTLTSSVDVPGINRKLIAYGIMSPTALAGFAKVVITAACFTESVLYFLWSRWDANVHVNFVDITDTFTLRYTTHDNGALVDIYYAIDAGWSKNIRETTFELADGSESILGDAITSAARKMFGSDPSAFFANADIVGTPFENSERLPNTTHGLNDFQSIDHICCLSAINPSPSHFKFLKQFTSASADDITTAMTKQATYQAICRTSIRNPLSTTKKKWIVTDRVTAEWLQTMFPGSRIHDLGLFAKKVVAGRPKVHTDPAERKAANRQRQSLRDHEIRLRLGRHALSTGMVMSTKIAKIADAAAASMSTEIENMELSEIVDRSEFQATFFIDRTSVAGQYENMTFDDLVDAFKDFSKQVYASKAESPCFSPAHYVANDCGTSRGEGNIAFARNIVLDIDDGTMSPDFFATIFPHWKMMIHSSWSHSVAKPKYRIVIATSSVVDVAGYSVITSHILDTLRDRGYYGAHEIAAKPGIVRRKSFVGIHGIDRTKLTPACILFTPSQGAHPEDQFLTVYDAGREPLDVVSVLTEANVEIELAPPVSPVSPAVSSASSSLKAVQQALTAPAAPTAASKDAKVKRALAAWDQADRPGYRDTGLFVLASSLARAGCDRYELTQSLDAAISSSTARGESKKDLHNKKVRLIRKFGAGR